VANSTNYKVPRFCNFLSFTLTCTCVPLHLVLKCSYCYIILSVVLYGCETWSFTSKEEHRLWVFENRVLRGMFGPKGDEVTGEWRKLHSGELHNL
jgi:hypothetical protein